MRDIVLLEILYIFNIIHLPWHNLLNIFVIKDYVLGLGASRLFYDDSISDVNMNCYVKLYSQSLFTLL